MDAPRIRSSAIIPQYISDPDFPWQKLRSETPSRYESYVDLVPGEWTKVRIEVHGTRALLYVHDAAQPNAGGQRFEARGRRGRNRSVDRPRALSPISPICE